MIFEVKPNHPSPYRINNIVKALNAGEVIAVPTDTCYALACLPQRRSAVDRMVKMRRLDPKKPRALIFSSIQQVSTYTLLDDINFRILRRFLPGPYCFILESNRKLPRFIGDKRQHIGVRMPKHGVIQAIMRELETPLTVTSAINPDDDMMLYDPWSIEQVFGTTLSFVVDAGPVNGEVSSVIDLTQGEAEVIRAGAGEIQSFVG
jgi:tRNA threonylcarbamoyl adenosine modification protein (Sua5/YciO/YrdC/YwlC family)